MRDVCLRIKMVGVKKAVSLQFTIKKYLDVTLPSAQVQPTMISKVNTVVQMALAGVAMTAPVVGFVGHPAFTACW